MTLPIDAKFLDLWIASELIAAIEELPLGTYDGAHRYDTDDEHVLHVWRDGQSWDVRLPKAESA